MSRLLPDRDEAVVGVQCDRLPPLDLATADRGVAHRLGHDKRLDRPGRLGHRGGVRGAVELGVEREERSEALGGVPRRDDRHRPIGHRDDLARGQDDVRVVRQDDDLPCIDRVDRLEQLTRARVRGLPTLDHGCDPELPEDGRQPVAGRDRHDAKCRRGHGGGGRGSSIGQRRGLGFGGHPGERFGPGLADVAGLVVQVLDADAAQRPDRQPVTDHRIRSLVVDMHLERSTVAGHEHGLTDRSRGGRGSRPRRATRSRLAGAGTSSRSQTPRRRERPAWTPSRLPLRVTA